MNIKDVCRIMNKRMAKGGVMRGMMFAAMAAVGVLGGCGSDLGAQVQQELKQPQARVVAEPCAADGTFTVWCGFKNPEDLALTPDNEFLLATGFGGIPESTLNEMSIIELSTMQHGAVDIVLAENTWGDPRCQRSTLDFSTHGLDIKQRTDGKQMVAVTNHLPEETVELFELVSTESSWQLVWRGCVQSPIIESGARLPMFNDVALTTDGAFYVTEMYDRMTPFDDLIAAGVADEDTGVVWSWSAGDGFQVVAGSQGSFPNGIVINPDEDTLFVNYWFSGETTMVDLASGQVLATHQGGRADNLTFASGSVWAAKHDMSIMEYIEGCPPDATNCFLPFSVHELDPEDLSEKNVWRFDSTVFGFGTVAMPVGESIWFGSAHGDRVARYDIRR